MNFEPLEALSIGPRVLTYLNESTGKGEVHTVFHRVINISWSGNLWSISRSDISNGPANTITNLHPPREFTLYGIKPGTPVTYDKEQKLLQLGEITISFANATLWKSPLAQGHSPLSLDRIVQNTRELESWLRLSPRSSGLLKLFPHLDSLEQGTFSLTHHSDPFILLAGQALQLLFKGLSSSDQEIMEEAASSLIGLGPGLTPSGDDFLAGLLLSLAAAKAASSATTPASLHFALEALRRVVIKYAPRLTNEISAQMLSLAAQNTGSELMENMVYALFYEPLSNYPSSPSQAAQELSLVGASSGFDQLLGILSGARLYVKTSIVS